MDHPIARVEEFLRKGKPNSAAVVLMNNADQFKPEVFKEFNGRIKTQSTFFGKREGSPNSSRRSHSRKGAYGQQ